MKKGLIKQAKSEPKYVLVTNEFGAEVFVSDNEKTAIPVTNLVDEALEFSVGFDNERSKLDYWKAKTGYELKVKYL